MSISDELEKLQALFQSGTLTREEFELAKQRVLHGPPHEESPQLEAIRSQNEIAQLDREWELERENYMVRGRYGHRHVPSKAGSLLGGFIIVAFGTFWTIMALSITAHAGGFAMFFPAFGVLFILGGVGMSTYSFIQAGRYRAGYERYQSRRQGLTR